MSQKQSVIDFLNQVSPKAICDDCLKERLRLPQRQRANQLTRRLSATSQYNKYKKVCDFCFSEKLSTSATHPKIPSKKIAASSIEKSSLKKLGLKSLKKIGLRKVGLWVLNGEELELQLIVAFNLKPALYAFVCNDELLYVGKTSRFLKKRLYHYKKPVPTQSTNIRMNRLLKEYLLQRRVVEIFAFGDQEKQTIGDFELDIPAGLEDDIIRKTKPVWNSRQT